MFRRPFADTLFSQNKLLETAVINQISFLPDSVVTISKIGNIRFYMRGKSNANGASGLGVDNVTNGVTRLRVTPSK